MELVRCRDQVSLTIEEFYERMRDDHDHHRAGSDAMLELIGALRAHPDPRVAYCLTSHQRLCLLSADVSSTPWYLILSAVDARNFSVEYRMPEGLAPWEGALVKGEAHSLHAAVEMILVAMDRSGGWDPVSA